jgi:hypothetical protein
MVAKRSLWTTVNPGFQSKPWAEIRQRFQRFKDDNQGLQIDTHAGRKP